MKSAALHVVIAKSVARFCSLPSARNDFAQEIWWALLEGRLDISELYDRTVMRRFIRDVKFRFIVDRHRHVSFQQPLRYGSAGTYADVIADPGEAA